MVLLIQEARKSSLGQKFMACALLTVTARRCETKGGAHTVTKSSGIGNRKKSKQRNLPSALSFGPWSHMERKSIVKTEYSD